MISQKSILLSHPLKFYFLIKIPKLKILISMGVTQKSRFFKKQDFVESPPHSLLDIQKAFQREFGCE